MKAEEWFSGLTFHWPRREHFSMFLFGCVFLSLAAHVATFFVFQVIYPQRVTIPPPAPQVSVLDPENPEHQALLRWIDAADPALVASANSITPTGLSEVPYRPSYATSRTPLRLTAETSEPVAYPPVRPALAIIRSADARPTVPVAVAPPPPTAVSFSAALAGRALRENPVFMWSARAPGTAALAPARILIGVTDRGIVRFTFLQNSCGHEPLDLEAIQQLERLHFPPSPAPLTWAVATFTWSTDAYSAVAPPPSDP